MKLLLLTLSLIMLPLFSHAMRFYEYPGTFEGKKVVEWRDSICQIERLPHFATTNDLTLKFFSTGGYVSGIPNVVAEIIRLASEYKSRTGKLLTVAVGDCASSCVNILASLNQAARQGSLRLQIDRSANVLFHGPSVNGRPAPNLILKTVNDLIDRGMDDHWLTAHWDMFYHYGDDGITYLFSDPELKDSGLIDGGTLYDASKLNSFVKNERKKAQQSGIDFKDVFHIQDTGTSCLNP